MTGAAVQVKAPLCGPDGQLRPGELTTVAETASYLDSRGGRPVPYGRPFFLRGVAPLRLLSIPSFMEAFPTQQYTLRFHDQAPASGDERPFTLDPMPSPSNHPALTADGRMAGTVDSTLPTSTSSSVHPAPPELAHPRTAP